MVRFLVAERLDRDGKPEATLRVRFPVPLLRPVWLVGRAEPSVLVAAPRSSVS